MRYTRLPFLTAVFALLARTAAAQTTSPSSTGGITWSQLNPGNDWAATVIQNVFPLSGSGGVSSTQTTVIGTMMSDLTYCVMAIAMVYVIYSLIMRIHRTAETSNLLTKSFTTMAAVRIGFATIMMTPTFTSGFSVGQAAVVQASLWGVGIAKLVYTQAVQAIGPNGMLIATPTVPGTQTIVLGLIKNELCRSFVNAASATTDGNQLVPEPTPQLLGGAMSPTTILAYNLSPGNVGSSPTCGSITIPAAKQNVPNIAGVSIDQSAIQQQALTSVLQNDIAGQVATIAQQAFTTHNASSFSGLQSVLTKATQDYTQQLTTAATQITQHLRSSLQTTNAVSEDETGASQSSTNQNQLSALGWTGAGAYFLEFAKLNGATLSLLSGVPEVTSPSYAGLGPSLSKDLAPLVQSSQATLTMLSNYVVTQDGLVAPGGQSDLFAGATPEDDGNSLIDQIFRHMHLSDYLLQTVQSSIAPTTSVWTDPFSGLMTLGNTLITVSVSAMGLAAILSSSTGSIATAAFNVLSGNFAGAAATLVLHNMMSFLATPIYTLLLGLLVPGLMIAFVLPMIPWVMWIAGVMGWLILVCEAVVAVPLWMLAHMTLEGDGLHGNGKEGYSLIFNVLFRPVLMLFGLFLGYFVFSSTSWLIRQTFGVAAGFVLEHGWIVTRLIGLIVLLSIFVMTHVVAAMMSFRLISLLPHHIPKLVGFHGEGRVDMDDFTKQAATASMVKVMTNIQSQMISATESTLKLGAPTTASRGGSSEKSTQQTGMDPTTNIVSDLPQPPDHKEQKDV